MPVGSYPTQVTSATYGNGTRIVSPDFSTTSVNVAQDPTRMPMADASQQRAPSAYSSYGTFRPANQYGQFVPAGMSPQAGPTILARATTAPEANPNYQNGWRNVSPNGQPSMNR